MKMVSVLFKKRIIIFLLFLSFLCGYIIFMERKRHSPHLNISLLKDYIPRESYQSLFKQVQSIPVKPDGFTFVVLGDTRSNLRMARKVLAETERYHPAFILHTGDIVRRGTIDEYLNHHLVLCEEMKPIPIIPVPGNHEEGPDGDFQAFRYLYGQERFCFDYGNCRFVGVNDCRKEGMSQSNLDYLRDKLSRPGVRYRFVVFHIPPSFVEKAAHSEYGRGFTHNAKALQQLMEEMNVTGVFLGHVHGFAAQVINGVYYIITGGGGAGLSKGLGKTGNVYNFVIVHVAPDSVHMEVSRFFGGKWENTSLSP